MAAGKQGSRQLYIENILEYQQGDGSFSLTKNTSGDIDITAMALQALAPYIEDTTIKIATDKALLFLSTAQHANGGFEGYNKNNVESVAQVIIALCTLAIDIQTDERFIKEEDMLANLLSYQLASGAFAHEKGDSNENIMSTNQGLHALVAYERFLHQVAPLYQMNETAPRTEANAGLHSMSTEDTTSFTDIANHAYETQINYMAATGYIKGIDSSRFGPDLPFTRAAFATMLTNIFNMEDGEKSPFIDVLPTDWYYEAIGKAYHSQIIAGVDGKYFNPEGIISVAEVAVLLTNTARYLGMDTLVTEEDWADVLSYTDGAETALWARKSMSFVMKHDILEATDFIYPRGQVSRGQAIYMMKIFLDLVERDNSGN